VGEGATAWPGNLALGATRSFDLAARAGRAIGLEAAAMGATLVFAPVCDLLEPASATPLGTRPFGSDAALVGRMAAAMVTGLQEAGVAAVWHFRATGRPRDFRACTRSYGAHSPRPAARLPFAAGIAAGGPS
jgi:beta-N-acetylhexosaminidase